MTTRLVAVGALAVAALVSVATSPATSAFAVPTVASVDGDGDRMFDDLEAEFARHGASARRGVIVVLRRPASRQMLDEIQATVGRFEVSRRFSIVNGFSARMTERQARGVAALGAVQHVEANAVVRAFNDGAQRAFGVTKARFDAPGLDGNADGDPETYSPDDLVAAVIDTGIDAGHKDLDEGKVLAFRDFIQERATPYDDHSHGTHVAATLAGDGDGQEDGRYRGVAPGAALVGVKVLGAGGSGSMDDVVAGIEWVVSNRTVYGIEAMNLSLGAPGCWDGGSAASIAIDMASDSGVLAVVAAGNSGPAVCSVGDPGAARKALTVANMHDTSEGGFMLRASSSRGPTDDGRVKPDVAAPGSNITSAAANTPDGYKTSSGTSMAAPFVAGLSLLMLDANPVLDPDDLKRIVMETAIDWGRGAGGAPSEFPGLALFTPVAYAIVDPGSRAEGPAGSTGVDIDYGAGRLDGYRALQVAGASIDSAPPGAGHQVLEGELQSRTEVDRFEVDVPDAGLPLALTLIVAEGQIQEREGTLVSSSSGLSIPSSLQLTVRDPAGVSVGVDSRSDRQVTVTDTSVLPGTYTIEANAPDLFHSEATQKPLRYFIDVSYSPEPDVEPPETLIVAGPPALTSSSDAVFEFGAPAETDAAFECELDGGAWEACESPKTYSALGDGEHTFAVRARDAAGNVDASPATHTFTIDTEPPDTTIVSTPPALGNSPEVRFEFASPGAGAFECQLDGGGWESCESPESYAGLGDGEHTFSVRGRDPAGNADPTPAAYTFAIDTQPPDTTILSGPPALTNSADAAFEFESTGALAFECALDGGAWQACESPRTYAGLGDGDHTFSVRARDGAGNADPTPATHAFTVDTEPSETTILSAPPALSDSPDATFEFGSAGDATFECDLDGGGWESCLSPQRYTALADGPHTFSVRAHDAAGNTDPSPAIHTFTIDTQPDPPPQPPPDDPEPGDDDPPAQDTTAPAPAGGGEPVQAATADTTAPAITRAFAQPRAFAPIFGRLRGMARGGTTFHYTLSEAAVVTIAIDRRAAGHRRAGKCVAATRRRLKKNRRERRCVRYLRVGILRANAGAGPNATAFSGRLGRRTLRPGSYRAVLVARDVARNVSRPATAAFVVVRRATAAFAVGLAPTA